MVMFLCFPPLRIKEKTCKHTSTSPKLPSASFNFIAIGNMRKTKLYHVLTYKYITQDLHQDEFPIYQHIFEILFIYF